MTEKHYHNDYKKLIGLDESRTASQKLLDRAMSRKQQIKVAKKQEGEEPRKKVKIQRQQKQKIAAEDALTKIMKIISWRQNIIKMQKSMEVLRKCLNEADFINTLKQQKIRQVVQSLVNNNKFPSGSLGEFTKLIQSEMAILQVLKDLLHNQTKQNSQIKQQIQIQIIVLSLISDDSFSFNKNIATLKSKINKQFQLNESSQNTKLDASKQNDQGQSEVNKQQTQNVRDFIQNYVLYKLMHLPNMNHEWVHSGVTKLLRQFIVDHKQKLKRKKQFLSEYNKFIQNKKIGTQNSTSDFLGQKRTASSGSYTIIEKHDSTNTWCKRQ